MMTKQELIDKLNYIHDNMPRGKKMAMVLLLGIKYHQYIGRGKSATATEIAEESRAPANFATEINKGRKLARYVHIVRDV